MPASSNIMTLAVFLVATDQQVAFRLAWQALCMAFLELPHPPSAQMTLIQSSSNPMLFQSFGAWHSLEDVQAMRLNPQIVPLMQSMLALSESVQPGEFEIVAVVPAI